VIRWNHSSGRTVLAQVIEGLLLLTCAGGLVAGIVFASAALLD
jgi:hypothetical protein